MTTPLICTNLHKSFGRFPAVNGVSFTVATGQILALLGPSGCGKTTTLRLIAGFEQLERGAIEIGGQLVADERLQLPPEKRRAGMVFQDYAIFPHLTVLENVQFGMGRGQPAKDRAMEMLAFVGLTDQDDKMPQELSGGQQQRVSLARALAPKPAVLLLDEPFSNLDASLRNEVRQEVKQLLKASGTTAVFVTHDQEEALYIGDEVAVMAQGQIEQIGPPETIFHAPRTRFVAQFLGHTDFIPASVSATGLETPLGFLAQKVALPAGTAVEILSRADDVEVTESATGNGRVIDRRFIGIAYIYTVKLENGLEIQSWEPHTRHLEVGTAVAVKFTLAHKLTVFHEGVAV